MARKLGRPSAYTEDIVTEICRRIALSESLIKICAEEGMPSQSMVYRWLHDKQDFREKYARARESQAEAYLDQIAEIADNATDDIMFLTKEDSSGEGAVGAIKHSAIQRARLQIDSRKWIMSKLAPKKYGDKASIEMGGPDGKPIQTTNLDLSKCSDEQLRKLRELAAIIGSSPK